MARKQVDLDLGTQALQPTAQRAGQYRVAVQQTPKTNSALQLAQALRYTPQVLGQATNIAQKLGAEAAVNATDVEGAMLDDETKGILGYDKAYQQGLVKRHFSMNEESIKTRFQNLASDPEFLKKDPDQFLAALGEERQRFNDELMDQFGGNGNREQAINALSSTFVDDILDATTSEWTDNKKQQTEMFISGDAQAMFAKDVTGGLNYLGTELSGLGMSPKERAGKMRGAVEAHAGVLLSQGKYGQAEKLLADASSYTLHGKAKLFGTTEGTKQMTTLRSALKEAQNQSESTMRERMASTAQSFDVVPTALLSTLPFEQKSTAMLQALDAAEIDPEVAQAAFDKNIQDGMSSNEMWQGWQNTVTELGIAANDDSKSLLNSVQDDLLRITKDGLFAKPIKGTTTPEQYSEASAQIQDYLFKNPTATLRDIPLGFNVSKTDTKIQELFETHGVSVKWRNDDASQYEFVVQKNTSSLLANTTFGSESNDYATQYRNILRQEAQSVWEQSGRDISTFNADIVTKSKEIIGDLNKQAERNKQLNSRLKDTITSFESRTTSIDQAMKKNETGVIFKETPYPLLQGSSPKVGSTAEEQTQINSDLIKERAKMFEDDDAGVLIKGSLLVYGFPTLESYDEKVRLKAHIGFHDFALGKEVRGTLSQAMRGWDSEDPTPEQKEAIQFWKSQGYRSSGEIAEIIQAQQSFFSLKY